MPSKIFSRVWYVPRYKMNHVTKHAVKTQASTLSIGIIKCPASATAPASPPIPATDGMTPININQTNQEAFLSRMLVFGPGMSEKDSRNVFLVAITYRLISACIKGLLQRLNNNHQRSAKPVAAPSSGDKAIEPLPTTLPVTIILGPINFKR